MQRTLEGAPWSEADAGLLCADCGNDRINYLQWETRAILDASTVFVCAFV